MPGIGLFFDTDTGNTRKIAKMIKKQFDEGQIDLKNILKVEAGDFEEYNAFIIGTPTLGDGELPENWESFLPQMDGVDLNGKTVALFGLGDQEEYGHEFVDAMGILYEKFEDLGASFIGAWPTEGYEFEVSRAVLEEGEFVGLVLDQDNQSGLTNERVEKWLAEIKPDILAAAGF